MTPFMPRSFFSIKHFIAMTAVCLLPCMSHAGGVYLLQLGSFDNLGEAKERWSELRNKYPDMFKEFSARFQDVQLPPDNFVVYRTQAGALEDRSDAEIVCDRLNSRGDECYVVETAMFRPDATADEIAPPLSIVNPLQQAEVVPPQSPMVKATKVPQLEPLDPVSDVSDSQFKAERVVPEVPMPEFVDPKAPAATLGVVTQPKVTTHIINPALKISKPALKPTASMAVPPTPQVPAVPEPRLSAMAPPSAPTIAPPSVSMPAPAAPMMPAPDFSSASAPPYDVMASAPTIRAPQGEDEEEESSFWSWFNDPFASDEEIEDQIEYVQADESDSSWFESMLDPFSSEEEPDVDALNFEAEQEMAQTQHAVSKMVPQPVKPLELDPDAVASFQMPPPPAPKDDSAMEYVAQQRAAAATRVKPQGARPETVTPSAMAMQAERTIPKDAPFAVKEVVKKPKTLAPALSRDANVVKDGEAAVEVAEAIRVPLTQKVAPPPIAESSISLPGSGKLKKLGMPSGDTGDEKTLWAQIFYFGDQQTALAYWEAFRAENPSFPPVRVRVTQPYAAKLGGEKRVSLRVGPFNRADMVTGLCDEVEDSADIGCKPVAEMGKSAVAGFDRSKFLRGRYEQQRASQRLQTTEPMYWVQLGAYGSKGQADKHWSELSQRHKPLLDQVAPNVASPIMNSAMKPIYRLRTGPYAMRTGADTLCANVKASGGDCLVVFSR